MRPLLTIIVVLVSASSLIAQEEKPDPYRPTIDRGLAWLVKQQAKDGSWSSDGSFSTSATAFAGMALLADGNTLTEGKYKANLRRAVDWFLKQKPVDMKYEGMLGADPNSRGNEGRYMVQHGVALSFLVQVYGEMEGAEERAALRKLLNRAVEFSVAGQTSFGGWFYTSTFEGHDSAENAATLVQLHGLMDARNAGLTVPRDPLKKAFEYLKRCTTKRGGIVYSGSRFNKEPPLEGGRPTFNAMALAAFLPGSRINEDPVRSWLSFCAESPAFEPGGSKRYPDLLPHFYFSKVVFHLKDENWDAAFPDKKIPDHLVWSKYRTAMFNHLRRSQQENGSWTQVWPPGPVFNTSLALNILLIENTYRPAISR